MTIWLYLGIGLVVGLFYSWVLSPEEGEERIFSSIFIVLLVFAWPVSLSFLASWHVFRIRERRKRRIEWAEKHGRKEKSNV